MGEQEWATPPQRRNNNGMLRLGFGSWRIEVSGRDVMLVLLLVVIGASLAWINYTGFQAMTAGQTRITTEMVARQKEHDAILDGNNRLVCALSMEVPERRQALLSGGDKPGDPCRWLLTIGRGKSRESRQ